MRTRLVALGCALAAATLIAVPVAAGAHPRFNRGLTIASVPNPISSGEGVLIHGMLTGKDDAGQTIYLYHRVGDARAFTLVGHTTTYSDGSYEFPRQEGVVLTNRSWFVRGPGGTHSRTIFEGVYALMTLSGDSAATTGQRVLFSGQISPAHAHERVFLQEQRAVAGNGWHTLAVRRTNGSSQFTIPYVWRNPGVYTLRAYFPGDRRNIASSSDQLTVTVQARQLPGFTIQSSQRVIPYGSSATISGVLDQAGTTTPEANTEVTLFGHPVYGAWRALGTTVTSGRGDYSFTVDPGENEIYQVRTTLAPHRHTARLWEGVSDVVTLTASPTTVAIGQPITFSGTVSPDKVNHLIYLQREDAAGHWVNVGVHLVSAYSTYKFTRIVAKPGSYQFRVRIVGGPVNVGGASAPVSITVTNVVAPVGTLPPA
jgi:hypothetical protein